MNIKKITAIYFSPNGSTKKIVNKLAKGIGYYGDYQVEEVDLIFKGSRSEEREFQEDELVVIGLPVYSDRLPALFGEIIENMKGNSTPAVAIVSYGNRDYGDALLELCDGLKKANMKVISGAAIVGQHCLNHNVAAGRPDAKDEIKILEYANKISDKINDINEIKDLKGLKDVFVEGNYPYHPRKPHRIPVGNEECIQCGLCAEECPVNAIDENDFRKTNSDLCIGCGHCIEVCPTDARKINEELFLESMQKLEVVAKSRKEIKVFLD